MKGAGELETVMKPPWGYCGHGAFVYHRLTHDWVVRMIGVLTLTPNDFWRRTHAVHHSTSGNLDRRGIGDIDTLTAQEYLALS
jgi:acyl-lipid omega-6 desaturase (Delta-12 desaturase)